MSVGPLVWRSVCRSVGRSRSNKNKANQYNKAFSALEAISNDTASARWSVYGLVTAPAQKHATDDAVYTALFFTHHILHSIAASRFALLSEYLAFALFTFILRK